MKKHFFLFLSFLFFGIQYNIAQDLKRKTETLYRFIGAQDSFLRHYKEWNYDLTGRLIFQKEYYYNLKGPKNTLWREEKIQYDQVENTLSHISTRYKDKEAPKTTKIVTRFTAYMKEASESMPQLILYYDHTGMLVKEDTFTYSTDSFLLSKCTYDYRGSTALVCDSYKYDNKKRVKYWFTHGKWTTINGAGDVVERKSKHRKFKYYYTSQGLIRKMQGKHFHNKHWEKYQYDRSNNLSYLETAQARRYKNDKEWRKKTWRKYRYLPTKTIQTLEAGLPRVEILNKEGVEERKIEILYTPDSLKKAYHVFFKGKKWEERFFEYDQNQRLQKKYTHKYNEKEELKFSIETKFNAKEQAILKLQTVGDKTIARTEISYAEDGREIQRVIFQNGLIKHEKTLYTYENK